MKRSPLKRRAPMQRNGKPIRRVSQRRQAVLSKYTGLRRMFLSTRPNCECCDAARATDVHHVRGRIGSAMLDPNTWMAACRTCHRWIHDNPKEARARGWLLT